MKKIALFLVLMTSLLSCSIDEPDRYDTIVLPIDSYILPETFTKNEVNEIKLKYQKPTACHNYRGIYYYSENSERTVGIYTDVKVGEVCTTEAPPLSEVSLNFKPSTAGTYKFKFYKGLDDDDKEIFEEVDVVVED